MLALRCVCSQCCNYKNLKHQSIQSPYSTICFEDDGRVEEMTIDSYRLLERMVVTTHKKRNRHNQSVEEAENPGRSKKSRLDDRALAEITETKLIRTVSDSKVKRVEDVQVGDRIARDFDGDVYFGVVEQVKKGKDREHDVFVILFDDGDCFELDSFDMERALKLYEACKRAEKNDPEIQNKIDNMEKDFNKEKQEIMRQLPDEMKRQFLQVGFARLDARSDYKPVIFLSPYDVFYPVRWPWLERFKKATDPQKVPRIVCWYGEGIENSFSLVTANNCLSYNKARKRGVADVPKEILQKIRKRKTLSKSEEKLYHSLKQIEADADKAPSDRIRFEKPKEDHELVQSGKRLFMEIEAELGRLTKTCDVMSS